MAVRTKNCFLSVSALLAGAILYILFRPHTYIAEAFERYTWITEIRERIQPFSCNVVCFYLGDFLWMFALCCGFYGIILPNRKESIICFTVCALCGIAWEMLQWSGIVTGTGDWVDIIMYVLACVASGIINRKGNKK